MSCSRPRRARVAAVLLLVGVALIGAACRTEPPPRASYQIPGADIERGRAGFVEFGCTSCHTIPGVRGADGLVGPPLDHWARRGFIAGRLPNNPENLIRWITAPQDVDPGNAMPDMGVPEVVARDMAAYLYTLE